MTKRSVARLAAIAALAIAATAVTGAPPAEAQQLSCPLEYACVYNSSGSVIYNNAGNTGNISISASNGRVWNHGRAFPGLDHIQLRTRYSGARWTICLHYGNTQTGAQPDPTVAFLSNGEVVTGWTWRGECVGNEDEWQYVGPA